MASSMQQEVLNAQARERNRAPFVMAYNAADTAVRNTQDALDIHQSREAEYSKAGQQAAYDAQMKALTEKLHEASGRFELIKQELARFDEQTGEHPSTDDDQALQFVRVWMRGVQLVLDSGTDEEKATLKRLLGQKR